MFRNLLQFWKGKDFLTQVLDEFRNMLDDAEEMFHSVCRRLLHHREESGLEDRVYALDRKINKLERDIRKRVIEHLSVQPAVDIPVSLLLMSVVKDAERVGDYAKNLLDIVKLQEKPIDKERYSDFFGDIDEKITALFSYTKDAFIESDENKANASWKFEREVVTRCEDIIKKVSQSGLSVNEAVCFVLIARYFKRLAAHLANIATSVILPVSDLDYYDEKHRNNNIT